MQTDEDEFLFCTPDLRLCAGAASSRRIREAFDESDANGVLYLATQCLKSDLAAPLVWAREWGKSFLTELCHTRDPRLVRAPDERLLSMMAASAPPMNGGEYLGEDLLRRLWTDLQDTSQRLADACGEGNEDWLKSLGGGWHLVGRVTFHLAENRRSLEKPFAFLATYTEQLSADCAAQHIPLGRVLTSQEKAPVLLDALLEPVSLAAAESALVRDLLQSRRLFQALAWTSQEAYAFLKEIPLLEQCGIVVKLPDWWKARRPARPAVSVSVEAPEAGNLGVSAMLSFRCQVTLGGEVLTDAEMALIRASPTGLLSLRGQWVEVNSEQLQQALDHWEKVQVYHENGVIPFHEGMRWLAGFSNRSPGQATGEAEPRVAEWSEVVAGKDLNAWLQRLKNPTEMDAVPGLQAVLRPYQRKGVAWLYFAAQLGLGVCLADDMGLGKTVQVIALLCLLRSEARPVRRPSILVVPASLVGNWLREAALFAPHLRFFVFHPSISSRETMARLETDLEAGAADCDAVLTTYGQLQRSEFLLARDWELAALDEAQAIKNPATLQSRSVKKLSARARVALTGTPIENRLGDLWSLFDFLNPGLLGGVGEFSEAARRMNAGAEGYGRLRRLIGPYLLRRLKTDRQIISDLPEKIEMQTQCVLTKKQVILYGKLVAQLREDLVNESLDPNQRRGLVLGYLVKFKQVCNHPSHWSGDGRFVAADSGKFARLTELASEISARQERCLVFTQFREMTAPLALHLERVFGRQGLVLHGGTPVAQRQKLVEAFQHPGGPPFFVLSVKAGGTGLTLTQASHVVHFDRWWNPAVENQATDRAFRIGQKRNVLVHKFVCPGTIEEKVDLLLRKKGALVDDILSQEDGAEKMLTEMNNEELLNFVRLDIQSAGC